MESCCVLFYTKISNTNNIDRQSLNELMSKGRVRMGVI